MHTLFERYTNTDFDNAQIRDSVLEYFVDKIYLYDVHIVITGYYSDIHHELMYDELYGDNCDGSSGFIYDENPGSGFVYLADGGTIANELSTKESFFVRSTFRESNP